MLIQCLPGGEYVASGGAGWGGRTPKVSMEGAIVVLVVLAFWSVVMSCLRE